MFDIQHLTWEGGHSGYDTVDARAGGRCSIAQLPGQDGRSPMVVAHSATYDEAYRIQLLQALSTALALSCPHTAIVKMLHTSPSSRK